MTSRQNIPASVKQRLLNRTKGQLFSAIYEVREDQEGEYYHLVTLWKSTPQEEKLYEEYS
jgi:hypothetical protein